METLAAFLAAKEVENLSPQTIDWYRSTLRPFVLWLDGRKLPDVKPLDIQRYLMKRREDGLAPSSLHGTHRGIRSFFGWLALMEVVPSNPVDSVPAPRVPKVTHRPTADEAYARKLLRSIDGDEWRDHRDRLIVTLLWRTGLRCGEVCRLCVDDVDLSARRLGVVAKGRKWQVLPFDPALVQPLWMWITAQRPQVGLPELVMKNDEKGGHSDSPTGWGQMTRGAVSAMLYRREDAAGLERRGAHAFRHGFAHRMRKQGADVKTIKELLGHASIQTTESYLRESLDEIQEMADKVWLD